MPKRGPQSCVKGEEVSSGSAVVAGGALAEAEARAPILRVKGEEVSSRSAGLVGKRALGGEQEHRA